ncbi:MAG TPA: serine/threonine protein kinase, partial [Exiguobacterium sp.]|nr:serine/threonine protein kinase [Exiguobacterium sp.]
YFSPEQAKGKFADEKSDIYSLGAVLYELVTGQVPFEGDSPVAIALKHLQDTPRRPSVLNPRVPQALENCIMQALAKAPHDRQQSVAAFKEDMVTALSDERASEGIRGAEEDEMEKTMVLSPVQVPEESKAEPGTPVVTTVQPKPSEKKKKKRWWVILLLLVLLGGAATTFAMWPDPTVTVPSVVKTDGEEAETKLEKLGFVVETTERNSDTVDEGDVISQTPRENAQVKKGSTVNLVVSTGSAPVEVPDVTDDVEKEAIATLKEAGFAKVEVEREKSDEVTRGNVIRQSISAGTEVIAKEQTITITVSEGTSSFELKDLTNLSSDEAKAYLDEKGLDGTFEQEFSSDVKLDQVIRQFPQAGAQVEPNDSVTVFISKGEEEKTVTATFPEKVVYDAVSENEDEEPPKQVIRIETEDAKGKRTVIEESIDQDETFDVPVTIDPGEEGKITIYKDDTVYRSKTITYNQAKDAQ